MRIQKSHWQLNKISAALLVLAIAGCKSGHEGSGGDSTPTDPDPTTPVQVSIPSTASFSEPTSGSNTESITVTLSEALSSELNLTISTSDVTARSEGTFKNYDSISAQVITIPAGSTSASLPLNILHNNLHETNKTLQYSISADSSDDYELSNTLSTVTISDADTEPTVSFSHSNKVVLEGDIAQSNIELSHYSYKDITITLEQNGIATDDDYTSNLTSLTVQIDAEALSSPIGITAKQDGLNEGGETVIYKMIASGNAVIDTSSDTLSFYIPGDNKLNDTGYVTYSDGVTHNLTSEPAGFPNQDVKYGLDSLNNPEHADGDYGFSYTKLDASGNPLPANSPDWTCVRDENSGLYIEVKQEKPLTWPTQDQINDWLELYNNDPDANPYPYGNESSLWRAHNHTYTWHDSDDQTNGGSAGPTNDPLIAAGPIASECSFSTAVSSTQYCNTENYIKNMNSFSVCGITDWRLPSPREARSFINYRVNKNTPLSGNEFFPFIGAKIFTYSSSVKQDGSAWCVDTNTGRVELCNKNFTSLGNIVAVSGVVE